MPVRTRSEAMSSPSDAATRVVNGFDTGPLSALFETLQQQPDGGHLTYSTHSRWREGKSGVFTLASGYEIDGELHHENEREHVVSADEYVEFGSTDTAPGPPELLMSAVGSCIAATTRAYAAFKGVRLTRLDVAIESDLKLHGMFGLEANVRPGLSEVRVTITIDGDGDEEALREVALLGYRFSPVRDTVHQGVPVTPVVEVAP